MIKVNTNYKYLKESYLFAEIENRTNAFVKKYPKEKILRLGVGDVTQPLCDSVISALHLAVEDQSKKETFHGYVNECGMYEFRNAVSDYYKLNDVTLETDEIFASSGAGDDLGDILDLFSPDNTVIIPEPTYPAYVDTNIMAGHKIIHLPTFAENGFVPLPNEKIEGDIIYLCSPNNPTGTGYDRLSLSKWVNYANKRKAIIIFDAAYEAFIEDDNVPHSIYEIEGSKNCAIEICSFSKTAGFTGMRLGYTVVPKNLVFGGVSLNKMWVRNRTTKTNGISYILQKAGVAAISPEGREKTKRIISIYKANAKVLTDALDKCNVEYFGGRNAPYIWMKCPYNMDSWEFFDYLLYGAKIIGTPGDGFGECGKNYFRLSTFGDADDTILAAKRLVELLSK